MSTRRPCATDEHPWEHITGVIYYPRCESYYWCSECGALRTVVSEHNLNSPEAAIQVKESVRVPQGAKI